MERVCEPALKTEVSRWCALTRRCRLAATGFMLSTEFVTTAASGGGAVNRPFTDILMFLSDRDEVIRAWPAFWVILVVMPGMFASGMTGRSPGVFRPERLPLVCTKTSGLPTCAVHRQFTKRRMRMFMTMPSERKVNRTLEPP